MKPIEHQFVEFLFACARCGHKWTAYQNSDCELCDMNMYFRHRLPARRMQELVKINRKRLERAFYDYHDANN